MKTTKISIDEYATMKKKLKFLEFYWLEFKATTTNPLDYRYSQDIISFINQELYDSITSEKVHPITKRVSVTEKTYHTLKTYSRISDHLKQRIE